MYFKTTLLVAAAIYELLFCNLIWCTDRDLPVITWYFMVNLKLKLTILSDALC